ncbi:S8 family serine peptidase [Flavobacterium psychrophilum]|uniref:S8 family serine peptidase n=1 Tax=Flavobacterium psychrophilum TaxID=96345 RepID=UPI0004F5A851|nr:S8 family serine peptidase [Flavobacterium psychrophilum]AIN74462.1 peptidase S8 [Flavobacterium psychrophilum FPG3]EKT2068405.1 S8 family serine peptidase [Flavobacterium psychrophilum]EKT2071482.1 S8 family serine peptidase [Flavobacterium psychrophilum]EKT4491003.1 S8 family serine peptidase [Flavobacterium psychrophilum]EKT4497896.1 S8 family serine peptidase [Flavobacterium psychrophilum]
MKKTLLFLVFTISVNAFSQEDAWVYFKDKPNASVFYSNPLSELMQRSLDRRTTQGIALDIKDAPIHQPYVDQITASIGIAVLAKSKWLNMVHVRGLQTDIAVLSGLSFVDHIQYANHSLNPGVRMAQSIKNEEKSNKLLDANETQIAYNYGNSANQVQMLNCHVLHQQNYTGSGKVVAILDAGFPGVNTADPFASLRTRGLILGGYNFVNNSTNFYTGNNHGTNVLSTMGGNTTNLVGTAPDASYYLFITEDVASETPLELTNWVEAAEEADRLGVDVINSSLGYFRFDNPAYSYTYAKMNGQTSVASRAVDIAFSKGMICVISAGNEGSTAEPHVGTPADAAFAITVGSVTSAEVKSEFSSIGPTSDGRMKPDFMAMGTAAVISNTAGTITTANGTSFSSPILAGAITSFWSAFPNKTNAQIVQLLKLSASRYATSIVTQNNDYGYGIPNFQAALTAALSIPEVSTVALNLYPNPATNEITISSPASNIGYSIKLYNNLGQLVLEKNIDNQSQRISLQTLNSGVYFYNIACAEKTSFGKLIKN